MYQVKIEQFEGPFDLLLELVEAKKLPLAEISLAKITDQFVEHIKSLGDRDLREITDFLVVASRLLLLKSRELVPSSADEEIADEGDFGSLERQLRLYQIFRRVARLLARIERSGPRFYGRESFLGYKAVFYFPENLNPRAGGTAILQKTIEELITGITLPQKIPQAELMELVSLEQCLAELTKICATQKYLDFSQFLGSRRTEERLVHFLGALELVRAGKVEAEQKKNFGTIMLVGK